MLSLFVWQVLLDLNMLGNSNSKLQEKNPTKNDFGISYPIQITHSFVKNILLEGLQMFLKFKSFYKLFYQKRKTQQTNKKIHFIKTTFKIVDLRELNLTRPVKIELCTVRRLNEFSISIYCNLLPPNKNGSFPGQLTLS